MTSVSFLKSRLRRIWSAAIHGLAFQSGDDQAIPVPGRKQSKADERGDKSPHSKYDDCAAYQFISLASSQCS